MLSKIVLLYVVLYFELPMWCYFLVVASLASSFTKVVGKFLAKVRD